MSGVNYDDIGFDPSGFLPSTEGDENVLFAITIAIGVTYLLSFMIAIYIKCKHPPTDAFVSRALVYLIISLGIRLLMSFVNEKKTKTNQTKL